MKKSTGFILAIVGFLCGAAVGFILSPVKDGIHIGSLSFDCNMGCNNGTGNTSNKYGRKNDKKKIECEAESNE